MYSIFHTLLSAFFKLNNNTVSRLGVDLRLYLPNFRTC